MFQLPKFQLYGQNDIGIEESIQPALGLRKWSDLGKSEKEIALQQLKNSGWLDNRSEEALQTIEYLNHYFLRQLPGKRLHQIPRQDSSSYGRYNNESERKEAAYKDFCTIFLNSESESLILRMITKFADCHINGMYYGWAEKEENEKEREEKIEEAFKKFDILSNCFNHIFEQFAVNMVFTRNGLVPRQDEKIAEEIYRPTLQILSDPKWKNVSNDLSKMFTDYREENYPEAITKAHGAIQRFLQILVGEEGKSGKGEISKLFKKAKAQDVIPVNRFTEPMINVFQGFITSERATNSTAKPALKSATSSDALLVMNVLMVFLQYCLQHEK